MAKGQRVITKIIELYFTAWISLGFFILYYLNIGLLKLLI